jgi:hypothetical protein
MKVVTLHGGSCNEQLRTVHEWLESSECEVVIFGLSDLPNGQEAGALTELIAECDAVVFLTNSDIPLAEVHVAVMAANARGKTIVNVQLGGPTVVEAFEKYGSASVPFNRKMVVDAVCGDRFAWTNSDGEQREQPETERHKCKKRKAGDRDEAA